MFATTILALGLLAWAAPDEPPTDPILMIDAGGHSGNVSKILFSRDGRELISASWDKTIRIWDLETGATSRILHLPIGHGMRGVLACAALSPDGRVLAAAGYNEPGHKWAEIYLIDLESGAIRRVLRGHVDSIRGLAFSPDGKTLASASLDKTAILWDAESGRHRLVLRGHTGIVRDIVFSPDGRRVATASFDKTARIWSVADGRELVALQGGHSDRLLRVVWSPDGQTIATSGFDHSLCLWNPDGALRWRSYDLGNGVGALEFTNDSRQILLGRNGLGRRFDCSFLDIATGAETLRFTKHANTVRDAALSPDNRLAATVGGLNDEIYVWRRADGKVLNKFESRGHRVYAVGWSPDGQAVAWGNTNDGDSAAATHPLERTFRLSELDFGAAPAPSFRRARGQWGAESISTTAALDRRQSVSTQWNGQPMATFHLPRASDQLLAFTLMPEHRAVVGSNEGLYLIDSRSGEQLREFRGHTGSVWAVAPSPDGRHFLTGSADQTLRIWDPDREEPLLSLFVAGRDWIAWTPQGYFAASPGGERLIGWHVNQGPLSMAEVHPAAHFRKTLYRPDVIRRLMSTGDPARALQQADKARGIEDGRLTTVAEVLPPKVAITTPGDNRVRAQEPTIAIEAVAESVGGRPVTALRLLLDGRPHQGQAGVKRVENPKPGQVRGNWEVDLSIGANRIAVQAESDVSKATSETVEILYLGQVGQAAAKPQRNLFVLAVGVADYPGSLKLHYAASDAREIARSLKTGARGLFHNVEVKELTDRQATREEVLRGLTWLKEAMKSKNDVGVVFFSGHGLQDDQGNLYLLPIDVDTSDLFATGVPSEQITKRLAGVTGQVVTLLDACHSGAVGKLGDLIRDLGGDDCGVWVIASSDGAEPSLESNALRRGNFTHALVEGLSGKADLYQKGEVLISHLQSYVQARVVELSRDRQHPVFTGPLAQPFALAKPGGDATADRSTGPPAPPVPVQSRR